MTLQRFPGLAIVSRSASRRGRDATNRGSSAKWEAIAEDYSARSESDAANAQAWVTCSAVALKRSMSTQADADAYASQSRGCADMPMEFDCGTTRRRGAWAAPIAMASFHAIAEPHVSTTANQAQDMAPWWAWWLCLGVLTLVIYPAVLHFVLRRLGLAARVGHLVGLGFIHLATGAATIVAMFAISIAYAKTSPMVFVGLWAALTVAITAAYVLFKHASSRRRPGHP